MVRRAVTVFSCDRCGKGRSDGEEMSEDFMNRSGSHVSHSRTPQGRNRAPESIHMDLCDSCTGDLVLFLTGWDVKAPPKDRPAYAGRRDIQKPAWVSAAVEE